MKLIQIDVVGVVKNDDPDMQILVKRDGECYFIYQWYGDDGPYDDWVADEDDLKQYFEETGWDIEWRPDLQMPTKWNWGVGAGRESDPERVKRGLKPE